MKFVFTNKTEQEVDRIVEDLDKYCVPYKTTKEPTGFFDFMVWSVEIDVPAEFGNKIFTEINNKLTAIKKLEKCYKMPAYTKHEGDLCVQMDNYIPNMKKSFFRKLMDNVFEGDYNREEKEPNILVNLFKNLVQDSGWKEISYENLPRDVYYKMKRDGVPFEKVTILVKEDEMGHVIYRVE